MATAVKAQKSECRRPRRLTAIHKPRGVLHPRVQKVGPEHFGIVSVDCAKIRSKWMLSDFYGNVVLASTELTHTSGDFAAAICTLRQAIQQHHVQDIVIAIERTGNYHLPVKRAFTAAGFECRIVHPFATKQFRQPADPGNKTDDTDLAAIFRATVSGFGLIEQPLDPISRRLRLLVRHRRDLVYKRSALCCQIREHLDAVLPGFTRGFDDLWNNPIALTIVRHFNTPEQVSQAGVAGLTQILKSTEQQCRRATLERILAWTKSASTPDADAPLHHRILLELEDDRRAKTLQIKALEQELVALLVQTPYVLLLSLPGINVVSAAELAGEMGPITHYAHARAITGRAGLFPARYQSDQVDRQDGSLVRCRNRTLRAALLMVADNLAKCNRHFRALSELWKGLRKDARRTRVKIASRFSRIAYHMVAGRQVFHHPCCRERSYILDKLLQFHRINDTASSQMLTSLQAAIEQLPRNAYEAEAAPLAEQLSKTRAARRRGPQPLGDILPIVLAKLGASVLQLKSSGDQDPS